MNKGCPPRMAIDNARHTISLHRVCGPCIHIPQVGHHILSMKFNISFRFFFEGDAHRVDIKEDLLMSLIHVQS